MVDMFSLEGKNGEMNSMMLSTAKIKETSTVFNFSTTYTHNAFELTFFLLISTEENTPNFPNYLEICN